VAAVLLLALFYGLPYAWQMIEPFGCGQDYRMPFKLGNDYWLFARYCRQATRQKKILVIGDSVIWGHYVAPDGTLSHYLNELAGRERFANLGVDGIHPAALEGLLRYYGRSMRRCRVVLHCNFLWMSSKRHDLQTTKEFTFNHPRLVPQFYPWIPCYRASFSERVGNVIERYVQFFTWARHVRLAYFDGRTLPRWTIEHPYAHPLRAVTLRLPSPAEPPSPLPVAQPWTEKGLKPYEADWVPLERSFQWRCFLRTVELLRKRGNRIFVLIGPFNEHMLTESSRARYQRLKAAAIKWLQERDIPSFAPAPLSSEQYADASHPLASGYAKLANELFHNDAFRKLIK